MALFEDTYDQLKIEKLKLSLQKQSDSGKPQYFEIYVDGLKAVPKTNDINEFDHYENFMLEDTEKIRILVYSASAVSPRNDQFTYRLRKSKEQKEQKEEQTIPTTTSLALSGVEIEARIDEKLKQQRDRWEYDLLKKDFEQTKKQLKESEEYSEKLEAELFVLRNKKMHIGNVNLGELASVVVEGFVRRNPQMLAKIPGGETLAGIIEADNKEKENGTLPIQQEPEVTFQKKSDPSIQDAVILTDEEKGYIQFMRDIAETFDEKEIILLTNIIDKLEDDSSRLRPVAELLDINVTELLK